jgi:hypothetical protein
MMPPVRLLALAVAILMMALPHGVFAQGAEPDAAIQAVIERQLDAMNRGDAGEAFSIASPAIQTMFGSAESFIDMVAEGYPQLRKSRSHRFLKLETVDGALVQRVLIDSEQGTVIARYEMIEIDGVWRINGCSLEPRQDA